MPRTLTPGCEMSPHCVLGEEEPLTKQVPARMETETTLAFVSTPHPFFCDQGYLDRAIFFSTERSGAAVSTLKVFGASFYAFEADEKVISLKECLEVIHQIQKDLKNFTNDTFWPNRAIIPRTHLCDVYLDYGFTRYTLSNIAVAQAAGVPVRANFIFNPNPEVEKIAATLGIHHTIFNEVEKVEGLEGVGEVEGLEEVEEVEGVEGVEGLEEVEGVEGVGGVKGVKGVKGVGGVKGVKEKKVSPLVFAFAEQYA